MTKASNSRPQEVEAEIRSVWPSLATYPVWREPRTHETCFNRFKILPSRIDIFLWYKYLIPSLNGTLSVCVILTKTAIQPLKAAVPVCTPPSWTRQKKSHTHLAKARHDHPHFLANLIVKRCLLSFPSWRITHLGHLPTFTLSYFPLPTWGSLHNLIFIPCW